MIPPPVGENPCFSRILLYNWGHCTRSSTDRAPDFESVGWGFESLRVRLIHPHMWGVIAFLAYIRHISACPMSKFSFLVQPWCNREQFILRFEFEWGLEADPSRMQLLVVWWESDVRKHLM